MRIASSILLSLTLCSSPILAQVTSPSSEPAQTASAATTTQVGDSPEKRDSLANVNLYLPEGEFSLRVRKLIKNVLFESQINYKFIDGDVSTFLRYKYYARDFTYKLSVFDTIEFDSVDSGDNGFSRVRGGLVLNEIPRNYNNRYFWLVQVDALSYGDTERPDNNLTNVYTKVGYQFGTPFDERLNRIVGESRGRNTPVLTAYREIGPQRLGLAIAATQGVDTVGGDYNYTKIETEAIKRFDFRRAHFAVSRLHVGSFLAKTEIPGREDRPEFERYTIPRYEFFKLGGREALKGIDDSTRGTDEVHLSNEYFLPVFRNAEKRFLKATWSNLYGIGYLGAGSIGYDVSEVTDSNNFVLDAGLGFEASLTVRDYNVILSAIYATPFVVPDHIEGGEIRFSVRTSR